MNATKFVIAIIILTTPIAAYSITPQDEFRNGIIGTGFVSNGGSSTYSYKVLIDYRIHGRHLVELKFVERSNDESAESELSANEEAETVMVNCTRRTYTPSSWMQNNNDNYGYKQYKNGDAISWDDNSEKAYANYGNGGTLPLYLKMVCESI